MPEREEPTPEPKPATLPKENIFAGSFLIGCAPVYDKCLNADQAIKPLRFDSSALNDNGTITAGTDVTFFIDIDPCQDPNKLTATLNISPDKPMAVGDGKLTLTLKADQSWGNSVTASIIDDQGNKFIRTVSLPYIAAPGSSTTSQVSINIEYSNDGAIAYRPVTLSPNWGKGIEAPKGVEYKWTVTGPDGVHNSVGQTFTFTPQAKGNYTAVLTVSSNDAEASPIVTQANLTIGSFDPPFIEILNLPGGGYVDEGTTLPIPISIQKNNWPGARNLGKEDQSPLASCHVTITGTTVGETPIFDQDGLDCNNVSAKLPTLPPGTTEKSYLINASINSPQYEQPGIAAAKPLYIKPAAVSSACQQDPKPKIFVIEGPTPGTDYDIGSNVPLQWKLHTKNCDNTLSGLSALCDFNPLGAVSAQSDNDGIITIDKALTQKLSGSFLCTVTGSNNETDYAVIYPPYYKSSQASECQQVGDKPFVGALSIDPSSLNPMGQLEFGQPATFNLPNTTDCDAEPSNLEVTLFAGTSQVKMNKIGNVYTVTLPADYWGSPIYAVVKDLDRQTESVSQLWNVPPVVKTLSACQKDHKPKVSVVIGPTPGVDYDINSNIPVQWSLYSKNCDDTYNNILAMCDFGPLGIANGNSDANGSVNISKVLNQKLGGSFACTVTGSNSETTNVTIYPPYYANPIVAPTQCAQQYNKPTVGSLSLNPSSLNPKGQLVAGSTATFDLPNTTDCNGEPSNLQTTLYVGPSILTMVKNGTLYSASLPVAYWGTPVYAEVLDLDRSTSAVSQLWSLPPIVAPALTACGADPLPIVSIIEGPTPASNYDISGVLPAVWKLHSKNCDGTFSSLSAVADFNPLTPATGVLDPTTGIITISKVLTQKLSGYFPVTVTGSNNQSRSDIKIYPPYYKP
ncbi:MAG: hypothetical protein WC632_02180 [Candidatus Margulisiibacteriota bacterium]